VLRIFATTWLHLVPLRCQSIPRFLRLRSVPRCCLWSSPPPMSCSWLSWGVRGGRPSSLSCDSPPRQGWGCSKMTSWSATWQWSAGSGSAERAHCGAGWSGHSRRCRCCRCSLGSSGGSLVLLDVVQNLLGQLPTKDQANSIVSGAQHRTAGAKHKGDAISSTSHIPNSSCPVRR
jgi:hypothetical protein